ncbi:MAG: DUF4270 family protein [Bacteroidetes bacterium]|nr:DUF4270 family protein [Bacteroidota bacterium]
MTNINFRRLGFIAFLSFSFLLHSCKKESNVGSGLIPDDDILNSTLIDTFTVDASTIKFDSILTEKISKVAVGELNDMDFGITSGQWFSQFLLSSTNVSFGVNPKIDSVILSFHVDTIYGSKGQASTFKAYALDEAFSSSVTSYWSKSSLAYTKELGSSAFLADTGVVKIKLQDSLGTYILNATATDLSSNDKFATYFKGLVIKSAQSSLLPGEGTLYMVNPTHLQTKITLYYHNDASTGLSYKLNIPAAARYFAKYEHDYSGTDLNNHLYSSSLGQSELYIQPLGGTAVMLTFPHLNKWANDKQIIIHRAELVFPRKVGTDNIYTAANGAVLFKDSLGSTFLLPDFGDTDHKGMSSPGSGIYYGGGLNNGEYRFLISKYLQKKITLKEDITKLILLVNANAVTPNRTILDGTNPGGASKTKLLLYYSIKK